MKIIFLSPGCFDKGGISRYNRYQVQVLREMYGDENVKVLSLLGPDANAFEETFNVYWNGNGISLKDKLGMVRKTFALSLSWKPDIIWIGHVNLSGVACLAASLSGADTILNVYALEVWSKMSRDAAWGLKKAKYIVSDCHNTANYLSSKKNRDAATMTVIWDCIDVDRFKPVNEVPAQTLSKYNIPDPAHHFNILSLGRLAKPDAFYKGYDRLLEAFAQLSPKYPALRLIFAGRGNYREDLEKMIREKQLEHYISFTGSVEENDLAAVYQSCHIFSLITDSGEGKGEGIPLTPLEAMACGKPILVGDEDGGREAIIENKNGFVLSPKNIASHIQTIEQYINDPALLKTQSVEAALVARAYFSYEGFKEKMSKFIVAKIRRN